MQLLTNAVNEENKIEGFDQNKILEVKKKISNLKKEGGNQDKLNELLSKVRLHDQLYDKKGRQMILADIIEYIFFARGYYSALKGKDRIQDFIRIILRIVNLLMSYETITVDDNLRKRFLENLKSAAPQISEEELFDEILKFKGKIGLPEKESDASREMNRYFDTLLPKTAGGLWHELLVYVFLLRHDLGYIVPLLLSQRFLSASEVIVPPDFLLITKDKHVFGIEVGTKKEIQSGSFSLITGIPTATIDTINSRASDRCPICKKWIMFCDQVIEDFSNLDYQINGKKKLDV